MKRVDLIVERIRSQTGNRQYSSGSGVPQSDIVQFIQNAQDHLFSQVNQNHSEFFVREADEITIVNGQEAYSIPEDTFLNSIDTVEFSSSGNAQDYYPLNKFSLLERSASHAGFPSGYILRGQDILLVPPATTGKLRINRKKELDRLDVRRGKISSMTTGSSAVTAITLDAGEVSFDATELNKYNYLCVVDRNGDIKLRNLEYDSIDADTGIITITDGTFTYGSTEGLAVGDYVVAGEDVTNRSTLPRTCERYLIKHAVYEVKHGDKSKWSSETRKDMDAMAMDIIDTFALSSSDIDTVTITDTDYMDSEIQF